MEATKRLMDGGDVIPTLIHRCEVILEASCALSEENLDRIKVMVKYP